MTQFLSISLLPVLLSIAGIGDVLTLKIPNWLTGLIAALFFPMALLSGLPTEAYLEHVVTGFGLLIFGFFLFAFGLFGGGDAKMLAAAALWFGWPASVPFLTYTVLAGGILALGVAVYSAFEIETEIRGIAWLKRLASLRPSVPYGLAIAAGAILAFPQSWWMQAATS